MMRLATAARAGRTRTNRVGYDRPLFAYLLNAPAIIALVLLAAYPILYSAWISLHKYNLKRPKVFDFIGLENYASILESPEFWSSLWITVKPRRRLQVVKDEPDNRILECALTGRAEVIVTGDHSLLALGEYKGVRIIRLREYLGAA